MSVTAMSRTFWTEFPELSYTDKKGGKVNIKNSTAKIVLLAIADNADDFGENSWQSFDTLATKSSIDRRSVIRVVKALVNHGFLVVAGVSTYGTNNYTISLEKLGDPPKKRAKKGRPKTSDSESLEQIIGDSVEKTSDSVTKTGDPASPESSFNPPSSVHETEEEEEINARAEILRVFYESSVGPITTLVMDKLNKAAREFPNMAWYHPAFETMKEFADHRSWNYVEKVLRGWKEHYFGWKPGDDRKPARVNGKKKTAAQSDDRSKYVNTPYSEYLS
jgi:hypothetical protein